MNFLLHLLGLNPIKKIVWDGKSQNKMISFLKENNIVDNYQIMEADRKINGELYTEEKLLYINSLGGYIPVNTNLFVLNKNIYIERG